MAKKDIISEINDLILKLDQKLRSFNTLDELDRTLAIDKYKEGRKEIEDIHSEAEAKLKELVDKGDGYYPDFLFDYDITGAQARLDRDDLDGEPRRDLRIEFVNIVEVFWNLNIALTELRDIINVGIEGTVFEDWEYDIEPVDEDEE